MITWDEVKSKNIPLNEIKEDSPEYEAMKSAAENGDRIAQYNMGIWHHKVSKKHKEAEYWYQKAITQEVEGAKESYDELTKEMSLMK